MKVNLKTTNEAENAAATPACHQMGQRTVNGIIGNTRRGIVVDQTLDPDSNNPVANKPVSTALAALAGKIDAALQKPTGLTKTKLVGVGTQGQENIEIGDNLTLTDGKLAAAGGSVSPILSLLDYSSGPDEPTVRTSITEEEKQNIEKGLYNSVQYYDSSLGETAIYSMYFPENATSIDGQLLFSLYKIVQEGEGGSISSLRVYSLNIGDKNPDGTYPITIEDMLEAPFGGGANLPVLDLSAYDSDAGTVLTDAQITAIEDYGTKGIINIKLPKPFNTVPATLNTGFVVKKDGVDYKNSFIEVYSTPVPYLLNDLFPIIALFDMRYTITDDKKLRMDYLALPTKEGAGDGFLVWDDKENKMVWKQLSTILPATTIPVEFKFNGTTTLTQEQLSLINSYDRKYVYVKFNEGIVGDNVCLGYVIKRQDLGTAISIVSQPNISGNIIVQSAISITGTIAAHEEITVPFSTTNSEKFLKTNSEGKPEWASISVPTITFED